MELLPLSTKEPGPSEPLELNIYAIKAQAIKTKYSQRLRAFLEFLGYNKGSVEDITQDLPPGRGPTPAATIITIMASKSFFDSSRRNTIILNKKKPKLAPLGTLLK